MTLVDTGLVLSGILFFLSAGLLIFGSYASYKEFSKPEVETAPVKLITKYHWSGAIGFGLSAFILFMALIGFTWENLGFSIVLAIAMLCLSGLDNFIRYKTTKFLNKRK
jgi:hypothetical protein